MKRSFLWALVLVLTSIGYAQAQTSITGKVTDATSGEGVPFASVVVKGTIIGVNTDDAGNYRINVPADASALVFSSVSHNDYEENINGRTVINVSLTPSAETLEQVVVLGYGAVKKSAYAGSANVVSTAKMQDLPKLSVADQLQGATTGVQIMSGSGQPGATSSIRIRGIGSFSASTEPLYVVDGVISTAENMSGLAAAYNNAGNSILSTINPSDVESITVIKDAAAASLYGSRAANGVIVITTKSGKAGKTRYNFKADMGFSDLAMQYREILGGQARRDLLHEGLVNYGLDRGYTPADAAAFADRNIDTFAKEPTNGWTDWKDELFRTGKIQNYEASIQGGNNKTTFYSSIGYTNQEGITKKSDYERYTGRLNLTHKDGRVEFGAKLMFSSSNQKTNSENLSYSNPIMASRAFVTPSDVVFDDNGEYSSSFPGNNSLNPKQSLDLNEATSRLFRTMNSAYASFEIIDGMKLMTRISYDYSIAKDFVYWDPRTKDGSTAKGNGQKRFSERKDLLSSTQFTYTKTFNTVHNFDFLAGYEVNQLQEDYLHGSKNNYPSYTLHDLNNAANVGTVGQQNDETRMISYLSYLNYNYDNKYYAGVSFRRDGSSRFGPDKRWGNFWSVSGSWRIINEDFMKNQNIFSDLKLRASYGVNGTQPSSYYSYMGVYGYGGNYNQNPGSAETRIANPELSWEQNKALNIGLDFSLLNNRLSFVVEYFNRITDDLLMNVPISRTTGFSTTLRNMGKMKNTGFEIEINSRNFASKDFTWTTTLNLSHVKNKIQILDGEQTEIIDGLLIRRIGKPYNTFYVREYAGVDPQTGDALFYTNTPDPNNSSVIIDRTLTNDASKAKQIALKKGPDPTISGSLVNYFNYKWFDLSVNLTYSLGGYSQDRGAAYLEVDGADYNTNIPKYYADYTRWKQPGDVAEIPRFVYGNSGGGQFNSDRRVHSTNHLRLKNLSFGFTLPEQWTSKVKMERARIFFSGVNLLTWAKYKYYDPEVPHNGEVYFDTPPLKSYNFGIEITF